MIDRIQGALLALIILLDKVRVERPNLKTGAGRFRVIYPDGERSIRMRWRDARDYCLLFGGQVLHIPTGQTLQVAGAPEVPVYA